MTTAPPILNYAGPRPRASRSWVDLLVQFLQGLIVFLYLIVRVILLLAGFAFVLAGTLLLVIGGRRGAARSIRIGWNRFHDLLRLWASDITRPSRHWWSARRAKWGFSS